MRRRDFARAALAASAALLTGAWDWPFAGQPAEESLLIAGAVSLLPFTRMLAAEFGKHNRVEIVSDGGGSLAGLIALKRGAIDIAALARDLKRTEDDGFVRSYLIGKDGIIFAVSRDNPVRRLSHSQVRDILEGRIVDWAAVGGPPGTIEVMGQMPGSATVRWISDNILDSGDITRHQTRFETAQELAAALAARPLGFGCLATRDIGDAGIAALDIDGVTPSPGTIYSGRYPFSRSLYYATRADQSDTVRRFLDFVRSSTGQDILEPDLLRVY
jgi:phosphate transport system substrate-binding protein